MKLITSVFEGINRAVSREEFFNPNQFWSLINVRILQSGNIGEIVRIKGYEKISDELDDLDLLYDIALVNNSAVGTENAYIVFYKKTNDDFGLKVFDIEGTLLESFEYSSDIDPEYGELKQHDNTIFVAPHNKIVYGKDGNFFLEDFISKIPSIKEITLDQLADKARYELSVNQTLSGGFEGSKATARIRGGGVPIQPNLEYSFRVRIGTITTDLVIGKFSSRDDLMTAVYNKLNSTTALTDIYDFDLITNRFGAEGLRRSIFIEAKNVGSNVNAREISFIETDTVTYQTIGNIGVTGGVVIGPTQTTFLVESFRGGADDNQIFGSARISIKDAIITQPIEITSNDSISQITTKLQNILEGSTMVTSQYDVTRLNSSTIQLEALEGGVEYNTNLSITINEDTGRLIELPENFFSFTQTRQGRAAGNRRQTIKDNTRYWYKARFRFVDGHITKACPAALIDSKANHPINMVFDIPVDDLDGGLPRLQVFRKEESDDFFLIQEVNLNNESVSSNEFVYVDDGRSNIEPFSDVENVWTKEHRSQEVMDNRLIKGNVSFFSDQLSVSSSDFNLSLQSADGLDRDVAPYNSKATLYVQPQYTDGSLGFFTDIGTLDVIDEEEKVAVQQTSVLNNPDKDISELKFYARYEPFGERKSLPFTTPEIISPNLGAIEDPLIFSTITKVFFGYKYVVTVNNLVLTRIEGWSEGDNIWKNLGRLGTAYNRIVDGKLRMNIYSNDFDYIPVATKGSQTIWKLEVFDALQEAVSTGSLRVKLNAPATQKDGLSSVVDDDSLTELNVRVVGIDDSTLGTDTFNVQDVILSPGAGVEFGIAVLTPPSDNRIYLNLEQSKLDQIDNPNINRYDYRNNIDDVSDTRPERIGIAVTRAGNVAFELLNFELKEGADFDVNNTAQQYGDDGEYDFITGTKSAVYYLINRDLSVENSVIYLGSKPNETDGSAVVLDTTGFRYRKRTNLFYSNLAAYNIYDSLLKESDFNFSRLDFTNQVIWSSPLLDANYFSGGRNFGVTNFYNVPTENGEIVDIVSLGANLYAFCEKGVARLLVGEVLTQQKSGEVFIDSSGFITKHIWLLENTSPIQPESIVKYEGRIYFTDGTDAYSIGQDGLSNISLGTLNLSEDNEYSATIVRKYNEYRLLDHTNNELFVYNTKYDRWYGPHTYEPRKTIEVGGAIISYIDGLMKEDVGDDFDGDSYTSIIQSVGNDTETGAIDKTYRKFYIDLDGDVDGNGYLTGSTFKYGKDFDDMESLQLNDLSRVIIKNDRYNIGIKNTEGNTKKIFWDIETTNENFKLKGIRTAYHFRRRR